MEFGNEEFNELKDDPDYSTNDNDFESNESSANRDEYDAMYKKVKISGNCEDP